MACNCNKDLLTDAAEELFNLLPKTTIKKIFPDAKDDEDLKRLFIDSYIDTAMKEVGNGKSGRRKRNR